LHTVKPTIRPCCSQFGIGEAGTPVERAVAAISSFHALGTKGTNRLAESRLEPAHTVKTMRPMVPAEDFEISERF
jgi:hypothetical protein